MEDKVPNEEQKRKDIDEELMKCARKLFGLTEKPTIPNFPINKKIQKKLLKEHSYKQKNNLKEKTDEQTSEEEKKEMTKKIIYPSGIIKTLTKNDKNQIINEIVDYDDLKQNYITYIKNNEDKELIKIIENSFLLYNRRPIIRNIVKRPYSTRILEEKILLWKYYINNSTNDEKALLFRKLLYFIGKFSEKIYEEFIKVKEISQAYSIFLLRGRIDKKDKRFNWHYNRFYMESSLIGYDADGNPEKDNNYPSCHEEMKATMLLGHQILNIKNELNGTGYGFVFLKELKEICEMYTNSSYIFESIFNECFDIEIFDKKSFFFEKLKFYRILWNFFVDYFIDDSFVMNFLIELKYIFGVYKQDDIVKLIHNLILYRYNIFNLLKDIKEKLEKLLGAEEIYDEKEKVEKMNNIDDVMKYIEGDEKPKKKKKKKKKKNENTNNLINIIENENIINNMDNYDDIDIDDSISIISEADSVLASFKNDILEETQFNTGNKIIPQLSFQFLNQFQK